MAAAVQLVSRAKGSDGEQGTVVDARERFTEGWLHMTATGRRLAELGIAELLVGTGPGSYAAGSPRWTRTRGRR